MEKENKMGRLGLALIVSGPSGTGKSTLCHSVLQELKNIHFSVSCTTRPSRPGEKDGRDYYFIDEKNFKQKISDNEFIEYAEVHGNFYGTLKSELLTKIKDGVDVLLDIDVQGAKKIRKCAQNDPFLVKCAEFVFIGPPSFEDLKTRLCLRGTERKEIIEQRLNNARTELEQWREYDYLIINREIDQAVKDFIYLYKGLLSSTKRLKGANFYE